MEPAPQRPRHEAIDHDDLEAERRRIGQRRKGNLDARILLPKPENVRALGGAALRAARRLELEAGEIHEIQQQELALELTGQP